jgi:hypothetical protein
LGLDGQIGDIWNFDERFRGHEIEGTHSCYICHGLVKFALPASEIEDEFISIGVVLFQVGDDRM